MKKKILSIVAILSLVSVILSGCGNKSDSEVSEDYTPVEVESAKKMTIYNTDIISGKIEADKNVMLFPTVPAKVAAVNVKAGDAVKKDDVLIVLDKTDMTEKLNQAKAGLSSASAGIKQAEIGVKNAEAAYESAKSAYAAAQANYDMNYSKIKNAQQNYDRMKKLYDEGVISKSQLEQAELAASDDSLKALQAQLDQAKIGLQQAQNAKDQAQAAKEQAQAGYTQAQAAYNQTLEAFNNMEIKSPIDGVVASVNAQVGQMASSAQAIASVVSMDKVYVKIGVTENMVNKIEEGMEVDVDIPAVSNQKFKGVVHSVSPSLNNQTQLYSVSIEVDNKDHTIKPGMFSKVEFKTDVKSSVLVVKSEAILSHNENKVVYIVEDGKALEKVVKVGMDNGTYTEIEEGIEEGDQVIIVGQNYVNNGDKVKIVKNND